ncbi:MAG TPA: type II toxin-antitoxin system death-on-curing family toxin [Mycobacteriales bacterium]|nr:type II toxin-antitoxin system death-on-curing family toxin [Mycobacteriales bacterium]
MLGPDARIRDHGLLAAALARPQATVRPGRVPDPHEKAAALLHSLTRNHALVDGNKRLGLAALIAFYGMNGRRLTLINDAAYDLVIRVAVGVLDSVAEIVALLRASTGAPRLTAQGVDPAPDDHRVVGAK